MRSKIKKRQSRQDGSTLVLAILAMVILSALGVGMLATAYGVRHKAMRLKNETSAMLAAEAGYEKAIFWMGQQKDMLSALQQDVPGTQDVLTFPNGSCDYQIKLFNFVGSRPVYRVVSNGRSGVFNRTVDVYVVQALSGWDMGKCRVPTGGNETAEVHFADGEIINMRLHINDFEDNPDHRDIYITGEPRFLESVSMGESRYTDEDYDKYMYVMGLFEDGIYFDQPDCKITDEATIQSKAERFKDSTNPAFTFEPTASTKITDRHAAVQLEFFVEDDVGKVRITDNCTVLGYQRNNDRYTMDFKIKPGTDGKKYERYDIYAYHFMSEGGERLTCPIKQTYVSQSFGEVESEPGGQIYVDGDVIIGGDMLSHNGDQVLKGKMTVVATGNIWIGDCISLDGAHDANGMPATDNPNILGLVAQGVIKVVDPGMSKYQGWVSPNYYPGPPSPEPSGLDYVPIGRQNEGSSYWKWVYVNRHWEYTYVQDDAEVYERHLPDPMIVEAAMTVGGGGWGAENVERNGYGDRTEDSWPVDDLIVRGTITEAVRGVVGRVGTDGFSKQYYTDERVLEGILPGDIWLQGKYIPTPAGWHDYRY